MGIRGDSIRLWYSRENQHPRTTRSRDVRDMVVWYSGDERDRATITGHRMGATRSTSCTAEENRVERQPSTIGNMVGTSS